ncbi:MAG TPA: ATP-dependent DNA ligase [Puia sp.]|nr:ATP-dependent DNA ligase [Puia sp.]
MRLFAELAVKLGASTRTNDRLGLLEQYFSSAADVDKVWVIAMFSGRRPRRTVNTTMLWEWCRELTGLPGWLFEESYHTVGDLAETIALLLPGGGDLAKPAETRDVGDPGESLAYYLIRLGELSKEDEAGKKAFVQRCWAVMGSEERWVFNKLITGGFRIGISRQTVVNALARATGADASVVAHRISGEWDPVTTEYAALVSGEGGGSELSRPYPFYLAYALDEDLSVLGRPEEWQAEWKWDGIRGQVVRRGDSLFVWSRGEELMTEKFPEYQAFLPLLKPGTVLDGEIIGLKDPAFTGAPAGGSGVLPFAALQTRIGRKNVTRKNLSEVPVGFIAYDLLEYDGKDWRERTLEERRVKLAELVMIAGHPLLRLSPVVEFNSWEELTAARTRARDVGSEGIMLKRKTSVYQAGRRRGDWWKWKIDPLVIDAVMVYAQKGHGRRSNLYTDYTFAVRDGEQLVTFTKAYSGLTDKEIAEVDAFVRRNSLEKFGPVRTVKPELVFEIAFEGIAPSTRHKSGVALRFPRINRWRRDKSVAEIDTIGNLKKMLELYGK